MTEEDWDAVLDTNLKGVFVVAQAVAKEMMRAEKGGSIINIASISGKLPELNGNAYSPSKAGVISLSALLAVEWAGYGIRVNAIAPGEIDTSILSPGTEELVKLIPLRRLGKPEEVADMIYFLCSDRSKYVSGAEIHVNGGQHV